MKNGSVILVGALAVAVTAGAVFVLTRPKPITNNNPAPGTIPNGGRDAGGWLGIANGLVSLGGNILNTFGPHNSPKPTSPGEYSGSPQNFAPLDKTALA